jgi:hypothetical protein
MARKAWGKLTDSFGNVINKSNKNRLRVGRGSTIIRIIKSGTAKNAAITVNPQFKSRGICGCRTGPISSSAFNST